MNSTVAFLRHILPEDGYHAAFVKETKRHIWHSSIDKLAASIVAADAAGQTIYHACASYREAPKRTASNVLLVKCLWLDIDLAPRSKYADLYEAASAVNQFCKQTSLPVPLYVS